MTSLLTRMLGFVINLVGQTERIHSAISLLNDCGFTRVAVLLQAGGGDWRAVYDAVVDGKKTHKIDCLRISKLAGVSMGVFVHMKQPIAWSDHHLLARRCAWFVRMTLSKVNVCRMRRNFCHLLPT